MNQDNYEYLTLQLRYSGFGETLNAQLKEQMAKGVEEFAISYKREFGKDFSDANLHFSRSKQGYYFFNKFDLTVHRAEKKDEILTQTYYNGKDCAYTLKEGYNLLCARAVNKDKLTKEVKMYNVWDKLNFTERDKYGNYPIVSYGERWGFNLERELAKHPIKELKNEEDRELLINSLKKGNRQLVKLEKDGEITELYVEANPKMRRLDFYDKNGVSLKESKGQSQDKEQGKEEKVNNIDTIANRKSKGQRV